MALISVQDTLPAGGGQGSWLTTKGRLNNLTLISQMAFVNPNGTSYWLDVQFADGTVFNEAISLFGANHGTVNGVFAVGDTNELILQAVRFNGSWTGAVTAIVELIAED